MNFGSYLNLLHKMKGGVASLLPSGVEVQFSQLASFDSLERGDPLLLGGGGISLISPWLAGKGRVPPLLLSMLPPLIPLLKERPHQQWILVKVLADNSVSSDAGREGEKCLITTRWCRNTWSLHGLHWYLRERSYYHQMGMKILAPHWVFSDTMVVVGRGGESVRGKVTGVCDKYIFDLCP